MRKTLLSTLLVALLLGVSSPLPAAAESPGDSKPVAVVGLAGYDELMGDLEYAAALCGRPEVPIGLKAGVRILTMGKGLAGLDKKRPWGAVFCVDGEKPSGYAFLPITDLDQLYKVLKPFIREVTDVGDGVYKVEGKKGKKPLYVKEKEGGWLFASEKPEMLAKTPADPCKLLGGMTERYDMAVRINVCNVPDEHREKFIAKVKKHAKKHLERRHGEDDEEYAIRKIMSQRMLKKVITAANDLEQVTLGWSLDRKAETAAMELGLTAIEGTKSARGLARVGGRTSRFSGFRMPGAAMTGNWAVKCPIRNPKQLTALIDAIRAKAFKDIEAKEHSEEKAKAGKQFVGGMLDVVGETLASGNFDGGVALRLDPHAVTWVTGRSVSGSEKLEKTLIDLAEAVRKEHPDCVEKAWKPNADKYKKIRFHTISLPIPEDAKHRDKVVQLIGETLEIVVGIGPNSAYCAAGKDAMKTLKEAIRRSEKMAAQTAPELKFSVSLSEIAEFMAEVGKEKCKAKAQKAAAILEKAGDKDHVTLTAVPTDRGVRLRLEFEKGALKLMGAMHHRK